MPVGKKINVSTTGVAIDGHNNEVKERHIQLVKKRGNVKALDEELYSECNTHPVRAVKAARVSLKSLFQQHLRLTLRMDGVTRCMNRRVQPTL